MLVPVFTLKLHQKIYPRLVTVGKFDGINPSIAAATTGGKIFIHSPHTHSKPETTGRITVGTGSLEVDCVFLNIGQHITAIAAGALTSGDKELLFVGTPNNLLAYDVENNQDVFYKEVPDGVNAICVGITSSNASPLVYVGGNCSIQGFNGAGEDVFWTVTGDNVLSLMIFDFDSDGENELLVGSEDYDIRVFKEDQMVSEISETDAVIGLCPVTDTKFGYSLANGTVGVYDKLSRYWRIKSRNQPLSLFSYDLDNDGVRELITGWSNGKIDARNSKTGEVVYKDTFSAPIAGVLIADYRLDGMEQLIVCSTEGEIRGYLPAAKELRGQLMDISPEQKLFQELNQKKLQLMQEMKNYEQNEKQSSTGSKSTVQAGMDNEEGSVGIIPANTQLNSTLSVSRGDTTTQNEPHVIMTISTTNGTFIHMVVVFAESLFEEGESLVVHPPENKRSDQINIPFTPQRDMPIDLHIKAYVGHKSTQQYHVFELTRQLPRFSLYTKFNNECLDPVSTLSFPLQERTNRIVMWLNQNFLLPDKLSPSNELDIKLLSLRNVQPLFIQFKPETDHNLVIQTDNIELAGEIVQSIASFLGIEDLEVTASFPDFTRDLEDIIGRVEEYNSVRQRVSAEMADHSNLIRSLLIRAEDCRLMGNIRDMKKAYSQLMELNHDLITGYKIRTGNHLEFLECLKLVNQAIQKSGRLRVGKPKTLVVNGCRNAIKNNNFQGLAKIIKTGKV